MICAVINGSTLTEWYKQYEAVKNEADLIELRFDCLNETNLAGICKFYEQCFLPKIITVRAEKQGGKYRGSENHRLAFIHALAELNPDYYDLEYHVDDRDIEAIRRKGIKVILSYHQFDRTPHDLGELREQLLKKKADYYKMALFAQTTNDALKICLFSKSYSDLIAISMGPRGQISRILSPVLNNPWTYAAVDVESAVHGQITVKELKQTYRYSGLSESTSLYGLIGNPVGQSISHFTHNALLEKLQVNSLYVKMAVLENELEEFLELAEKIGFKGLSVTMPLKEKVLSFASDSASKKIGAVNTLKIENGICGTNTDYIGAIEALKEVMDHSLEGKRVLLLGAGGAAKAIAYGLVKEKCHLMIVNRTKAKVEVLAQALGCKSEGLDRLNASFAHGYDIIINCIPHFTYDFSFIPEGKVVMDIQTYPKETLFLKAAELKNNRLVYGYSMFVSQAVKQFQLWFPDLKEQQIHSILNQKALEFINAK